MTLRTGPTSETCQVLSTELHAHCKSKICDCPCHLRSRGNTGEIKRVHSIPRERWDTMSNTAKHYASLRARGIRVKEGDNA